MISWLSELGDLLGHITAPLLPACPLSLWGRLREWEHDGAYRGPLLTFQEAKVPTSTCEVREINVPHSLGAHSTNKYLFGSVL